MVQRYSRRAAMLTAAAAVLAPVGGFADTAATPAPTTGLRTFRVFVEDFFQTTIRAADVATALKEAEGYGQAGDHLAVWEGCKLVGYVTESGPVQIAPDSDPTAAYTSSGIPKAVTYVASGPRPASSVGRFVLPADSGNGYFILEDLRPAAQLEAIARFCNDNDRSPETMSLVSASLAWR